MKLFLHKSFFGESERLLIQAGAFSVTSFLYSTGVAALRVKNEKGELIWLPFKGQQIWRASFCGRDLTMKSIFPEPADTPDFDASYGCFLLHCGMTAMGNPAPEDTHPQHGELPSIQYDRAYVELGADEKGAYIVLGGAVRYRRCFAADYTACPSIRFYEAGTVMDISMTVENHRADPLDYLYLCHLNFRPIENAQLLYSSPKGRTHIKVHKDIPDTLPQDKAARLAAYLDKLEQNPALMDVIHAEEQVYEPEIVFSIFYDADDKGWARCLQLAPDGGADFVAFRPSELPYGLRWIARTGNEDALGMCLPATAEHKGLHYCKEHGQLKTLPSGETITFHIRAGWLPPEQAAVEAEKCRRSTV